MSVSTEDILIAMDRVAEARPDVAEWLYRSIARHYMPSLPGLGNSLVLTRREIGEAIFDRLPARGRDLAMWKEHVDMEADVLKATVQAIRDGKVDL